MLGNGSRNGLCRATKSDWSGPDPLCIQLALVSWQHNYRVLCCVGKMGRSTHCGGNRNAAAASTVRLRFINEPLRETRLWSVNRDSKCICYCVLRHCRWWHRITGLLTKGYKFRLWKMPITTNNFINKICNRISHHHILTCIYPITYLSIIINTLRLC